MKRIIIIGAALTALAGAVVAYAASSDFNTYTATAKNSPPGAGSHAKPVPFADHQVWTANGTNGHRTAPIKRIVGKFFGVVTNGKDFPVCTASMINNAGNTKGWNKVCPKGSVVAKGPVNALFVPAPDPSAQGTPCNPYLYVYNGGQGVQVDFFTEYPYAPGKQYTCAGGKVMTGAAAAYNTTLSEHGGFLVSDTEVPPAASTEAGGIPGVYASLVKYNVTFLKLTKKVNGKTVGYEESVACKNGKRPYSFTFTAQNYQGQSPATQTTTIAHTGKC